MDLFCGETASKLVGISYVSQANQNVNMLRAKISELIEKQKLPSKAFTDQQIEVILNQISLMDSNNFSGNAGVGEREGRCFSSLVQRRNYGFLHGIGRSGDVAEVQPKAAGSSLLAKLCTNLTIDALKMAGIRNAKECLLVPVATGMGLSLCMMALRESKPKAKFVIFLRIDQKSCFKSIATAGFSPLVINGRIVGDEIQTDLEKLREVIVQTGSDSILCVISTTSCFAPRVPDNVPEVSKICHEFNIAHIVNNAYGLQSSKCCHLISEAARLNYRIDAFVQSMDKNFGVPVGGCIIAGFGNGLVGKVGKVYPGRASMSPLMDLFITYLSLGAEGYSKLLSERRDLFTKLKSGLKLLVEKYGEILLETKHNDISMAVSLSNTNYKDGSCGDGVEQKTSSGVTRIGSMLFTRFVSGARVVDCNSTKEISGVAFKGFGSHVDCYKYNYLTVAAAVGMQSDDITTFIKRFDKVLAKTSLEDFNLKQNEVGKSIEND